MMKSRRYRSIAIALSAILCLAACSGDYSVDSSGDYPTPDYSKPQNGIWLKCSADLWDGNSLVWGASDNIGMSCDTLAMNKKICATNASAGKTVGEFYSGLDYGDGVNHIYVCFPYSSNWSENVVSGTLASVQTQNGASLAHIKNYSLFSGQASAEKSDDAVEISLQNHFAYVRVSLLTSKYTDWYVKSIKLAFDEDAALTGAFELNLTDDVLNTDNALHEVTLNIAEMPKLNQTVAGVMTLFPTTLAANDCAVKIIIGKDDEDFDYAFTETIAVTAELAAAEIFDISFNLDEMKVEEAGDESINLSATQTANCYIASKPGTVYRFDATVMGNGYTTPATDSYSTTYGVANGITPTALEPMSAGLLWQTSPNLISNIVLKRGRIYFTTSGSVTDALAEGNAVIAVYDGADCTGNILWSWHIWITAADLEALATAYAVASEYASTPFDTPKIMDRNLGALNNLPFLSSQNNYVQGLKYQWGRKDPFLGSNNSSATANAAMPTYDASGSKIDNLMSSSSFQSDFTEELGWYTITGADLGEKATIENTIKHPMQYISNVNTTLYNWLYSADDKNPDDLWGCIVGQDDLGHKTIYDPCPAGWRVAHGFAFTGFTSDGNAAGSTARDKWNATTTTPTTYNGLYFYTGGWQSGATHYYPTAGYNNGVIGRTGYGYYWTNSAYSSSGVTSVSLQFDANNVYPKRSNQRYLALPLRCMQE